MYEVQLAVKQCPPPITPASRVDRVVSRKAKLRPVTVTDADRIDGPFEGAAEEIGGASNVRSSAAVETVLATVRAMPRV